MTGGDLAAALEELPLFPLPQVVLFPRALLPLHIFEPRYRALLADSLKGHRMIAMAKILDGAPPNADGNPAIAPIAGIGHIVEHQQLPDGRANVVLHGRARVRLDELPFRAPYRRARATVLCDRPGATQSDRTALVTAAGAYAGEMRGRDPRFDFSVPPNLDTGALADVCAHHLLIAAEVRQTVLESIDAGTRTRIVIRELAGQHASMLRTSGGVLH